MKIPCRTPCENCILLPICRHRDYGELHECDTFHNHHHVSPIELHRIRLKATVDLMKPTIWTLGKETRWGYQIRRPKDIEIKLYGKEYPHEDAV